MKMEHLQQKLIAAARNTPADERVPFAFEKRIMARLNGATVPDNWVLWSRALWRAAVPCLMLVVFASLWSSRPMSDEAVEFSMQFEDTVLAELNQNLENSW
jgi:hypothetical protein